jgi:DNA-directed RNA polymerase specialized sigma24 family protein
MLQTHPPLVQIILRYDAPLQRYARRMVKDQAVSAAIVKEVFELVYGLNGLNANDKTLRMLFMQYTFKIANTWLLHRASVTNPQNNKAC